MTAREAVAVLIFEHAGWRLGVDVDQVEALESLPPCGGPGLPVTCEYEGQRVPSPTLAAWLGLDEAGGQPSRLLVTRGAGGLRAFLVNVPRDILMLPLEAVYPVPVLVRRALGVSPFWGVGHDRHRGELILLVDLGANVAHCTQAVPGARAGSRGGES